MFWSWQTTTVGNKRLNLWGKESYINAILYLAPGGLIDFKYSRGGLTGEGGL